MFTTAEIVCGASGFSLVMGMVLVASVVSAKVTIGGAGLILIGLVGLGLSTKLHELDQPFP
jgi:hypothetical protein